MQGSASCQAIGKDQEAVGVLAYRRFLAMTSLTSPGLVASAVLVAAHNLVTGTLPAQYVPVGRGELFCVSSVLQSLPGRYYPDLAGVSWFPPCEASLVPGLGPAGFTQGPDCADALPEGCR